MRRLLIAFVFLAANPALAGMQVDPFPIGTMMTETGLEDVIDQFGDVVAESIDQPDGPTDQSFIAGWKAVAGRMFDPAALNASLAAEMAGHRLSTADQAELRAFYESDLGRHATALDIAGSRMTAAQQDALYEQGKKLLPTLPPERAALLDEYWRVAAAPTLAISRQLVEAQVLATLLSAKRTGDVPWSAVEDTLDRLMPKVTPGIKDSIVSGNAVLYGELSDAELRAYLAFLKSPAAQRFYLAAAAALDEVLGDEMMRFGNSVAVAANGVSA